MSTISIASSAVTKIPVKVGSKPIDVQIQSPIILGNVLVYVEYQYDDTGLFAWAHLTSSQSSVVTQFQKNGFVQFVALLVPKYNRVISSNPLKEEYIVGAGDGTGSDFQGTNAVTMAFTLTPNQATNNILAYKGSVNVFYEDPMLNQGTVLKASIKDSNFNGGAANNQSVNLSIEADANGKSMLEDMVWLHLYDGSNNLLGIVDIVRDRNNNPSVINNNANFKYGGASGDFQVFALIVPKTDPNDPNSTLFDIGDPKTNAKVRISQS
ncbi:MAG: hypothetical protein IPN33_18360 [Saprospiraceae bacterium]|nr:hypothetical protein [Saprospiraceae bacterium]